MLRLVIQNEELPYAISTKFNKVQDFKLDDLENAINILEYRAIPLEKCKIVVQSVKIPAVRERLYLTKDTIPRKSCIITVRNDDTTCLARSIVTAMATAIYILKDGRKRNSIMVLTSLGNCKGIKHSNYIKRLKSKSTTMETTCPI